MHILKILVFENTAESQACSKIYTDKTVLKTSPSILKMRIWLSRMAEVNFR